MSPAISAACCRLALIRRRWVLIIVLAVLIVAIVGRLSSGHRSAGQIEIAQHVERKLLEGLLIVDLFGQPCEIAAAFSSIQSRTSSTPPAPWRHRLAGQRLAQQQGERGLERHFGGILARARSVGAVRSSVAASRLPRMPA
jgi:hypothetical protein